MGAKSKAIVFDLGGVLVDWNPRYLYRKLFDDDAAMEEFLTTVCTPQWHGESDRGRPMLEGVRLLSQEHPEKANLIAAYEARWEEMFNGTIAGTVSILEELGNGGWPCYALTNFPADKFDAFYDRFAFLTRFEDIVVSGREKMIKPDPRLYQRMLDRFGLTASQTVFVDDLPVNVDAARALGIDAIHFTTPESLRDALGQRGIV